jgi:3-hydroxyacyl-CoA dehydrogenase
MLEPYVFEARRLLLEGALPAQVDNALQAWGMAMGPFRMYDVVGIDLEWRARQLSGTVLEEGSDAEMNVRIDNRLCELERFGQKSGQGYYRYEAGSREALVDDSVNALVIEESGKAGFERRDISDDEIVSRCILALVNEGAKILDEGIARNSADIDKVYLNGYGFPKERGGPMAWADSEGLVGVLADMKDLQQANGNRWEPAALLKSLAADGQTFSSIKN